MKNTLYVQNRAQAAIYEFEMKGQISDGRWENSSPTNHWHVPCDAAVEVRPEKIGRNFRHMRGYNFGETELFEIVGERMMRFAQVAIAFPDVSLDELDKFHWNFDEDIRGKHYSDAAYNAKVQEAIQQLLKLVGVESADEFEAKLVATNYTLKDAKRDASKLTTCFRTQVDA